MIIDAHAHITSGVNGMTGTGATRSLAYGQVQWGNRIVRHLPPMARFNAFPPEMLLEHMDWIGVDKAVLMQGPFYGEANAYISQAVKRWPDRFVGTGYVDPRAPDARDVFLHVTEEYGFHVLKFELSVATGLVGLYPDLRLDEDALMWIWDESARRGLVITLDLGAVGSASYQTGTIRYILDRYPTLKIVIAHLAQPPIGQEDDTRLDALWQEQVLLARYPNVWCDLSALPAYGVDEEYPFPSALRYIRRAVDMVGASKLMWGTDVPGLLLQATYPQLLDVVAKHCDALSASDRDAILGTNAWRVYGEAV